MQEITMAPSPDKDVFIVFDYLEHDLNGIMKNEAGMNLLRDERKGEIVIKGLMHQLVMGLEYLHNEAGVIHRDMKGSNILIDKFGKVKLADFGLARSINGPSQQDGDTVYNPRILPMMTNRVITLWFRPPEVLLGDYSYGSEVDIWGLGCIFAELFLGKPTFAGSDEISQLEAILIGLKDEQKNPNEPLKMFAQLPWYKLIPKCLLEGYQPTGPNLRDRLKESKITKEASNLMFSMLEFDPKKRITCREALKSEYFAECSKKQFYELYRRLFETSNFFNSELKSSEPCKK